MMYLVEGRNPKETRGQYVLSKEAAYAILEEMKKDFLKVNIYEKENGEYKRIEKWERQLTNYDWLNSLPIDEQAEALNDLYWEFDYRARLYYNFEPTKESFEKWLKKLHNE